MNCQEFNERLYEYLDEALPTNVQAAAREHLQLCEDCRRALEREKVMAQSIESSLNLATARLSVGPELRRRIIEAPRARPVAPGIFFLIWQWFALKSIRFAGAAAALLVSILLFVGLYNRPHPAAKSPSPVAPNNNLEICVIDVPFYTETHLLQQQGGHVVDAIASSAAVGHAFLFEPIQ
jgi:predicted anti-sigma-YlaC factor YlaD